LTLPLIREIWSFVGLLRSTLIGLAMTLFFSVTAYAVEVPDLYRVDLPVSSQQSAERKRVTTQALDRVIRRITANTAALNEPVVQVALQRPERYLQQFSYYLPEDSTVDGEQRLRLLFDETLVNRLLRQAKQPIWGNNRPGLMIWAAVEGRSGRHLVRAAEQTVWQRALKQAGQDAGLPILLPLMDLQDETSISLEDVWGLFRTKLDIASQRYRSETVLGGRVYQTTSGQWAGQWLLIFEGETINFATEGGTVENMTSDALAQVASILVTRYAIDTTSQDNEQIKLAVQGVQTLQDYASVMSYLKGFAMVRNVAVSDVENERLTLVLTTEGGWDKLKGLIALGKQLTPALEATPEFDGDMLIMSYHWSH